MSWISQPWFDNMAIDFYNSNTGVTSRIATGSLRVFWQTAWHQNDIANNLNGSGNLQTIYTSYSYDPSPQYDEWSYVVAETLECSDLVKGSYICQHYFDEGQSGDIIWWYNKDNPNFKIGLQFRGKGTSGYGTYYKGRVIAVAGALAVYGSDNQVIWGIDSNNQKREWVLSVMIDGIENWAYPIYMESVHRNSDDNTGAKAYPYGWYASDRSTFNNWKNLYYLMFKNTPPEPTSDPYSGGGTSTGTDTGTGTFDDASEDVDLPLTYAMSATAAGLMSEYVMTEAELAALGNWLWNGGSIIDDLKHFYQSPMEAIFSLGMLPFTPSDVSNYNVYVGALDANTTGKLVNDTVEKINMGSIDFDGYYGSALDFNPYTKIEIFLPYCGNFQLNPDEVMGHAISVDYYVDTVSGDCVAFISDEKRVLYQVKGNCFVQIPLTARDFTAQYASAIGLVGTVAAGLAASVSGGLTAPIAVGMGTSMAANAMNAKAHVSRAGGVSGMAGFMAIQTPYVIITIPRQCLPDLQNSHQGYPLFVTKRLGDCLGYTKVYEIHLDGCDCTDAEAKEIYELLKGGVII